MGYVKHTWDDKTWSKGQRVFQQQLNEMESGIESAGGGGTGKNWYTINLTLEDMLSLIEYGNQISKHIDDPYDPTTFVSDYFKCIFETTPTSSGAPLRAEYPFQSLRIDCLHDSISEVMGSVGKNINYAIQSAGFDYHYYKTIVLAAGCTAEDEGYADQGMGGRNVVYLQDVTQQSWEQNPHDGGAIAILPQNPRENINKEWYGGAYVIAIQGGQAANDKAILICLDATCQAAYWDSTANDVRWAYLDYGKAYAVDFDPASGAGAHGTERWLLHTQPVEDPETELIKGVELTTEEKNALYNTGIAFGANLVSADTLGDADLGLKGVHCILNGDKSLVGILSWNEPFDESPAETQLEFIGRPTCYLNDTLSYYDPATEHWEYEDEGYWVWSVSIEGGMFRLIIPGTNLDTYIIVADPDASYGQDDLVRHSFKIEPDSYATFEQGEAKVNFCFTAYNCQWGESSLYYVLYSDCNNNYANVDWIHAGNGFIGFCGEGGAAPTHYYPVSRIIGQTVEVNEGFAPELRFTYFDDVPASATFGSYITTDTSNSITSNNYGKHICRDFRSSITTMATVESDRAVAKEIK